MLKQRIVAFVAGLALIVAVAGGAAGVAHGLASTDAPVQTIACNSSGSSGGGC
jgi:hypothetical protein